MAKPILTDTEIATLKAARKILKRVSAKHQKLVDKFAKTFSDHDDEFIADYEEALYKQANIDFIEDDQAFIKF